MDSNIQVLIIDDEEKTRFGMQKHIHWKDLGVNKIFLAEGYVQAFQVMQVEEIDIVVSDIQMPRMNGIELCNELRKLNPDVKIIFLSGYSDKEYLKGAIHLSAIEYLEKPINIQEMEECIEKAVGICLSEKESVQKQKETRQLIDTSTQIIKEQFMQELLRGKFDQNLYEKLPLESKLKINEKKVCSCVIIRFLHRNLPISFDVSTERKNLEELFDSNILFSCTKEDHYIILCLCADSEESWKKEIDWSLYLYRKSREKERITVYITKSILKKGIENLTEQYQQALISMQNYIFYGNNQDLHIITGQKDHLTEQANELYQMFCKAVVAYKKDETEYVAELIYELYQKSNLELPDVVKNQFFHLNYFIYQEVRKSKLALGTVQDSEKEFLWSKISNLETLEECYICLKENINEYFNNFNHMVSDNRTILQSIEYIKQHFSDENISIKDIADHVYLSSNYLSVLFKQKTGKTVGQYIRKIRMDYAALLMEDRSKSVSDIAIQCGYVDSKYFTKVFKMEFKVSPQEYREKILRIKES